MWGIELGNLGHAIYFVGYLVLSSDLCMRPYFRKVMSACFTQHNYYLLVIFSHRESPSSFHVFSCTKLFKSYEYSLRYFLYLFLSSSLTLLVILSLYFHCSLSDTEATLPHLLGGFTWHPFPRLRSWSGLQSYFNWNYRFRPLLGLNGTGMWWSILGFWNPQP